MMIRRPEPIVGRLTETALIIELALIRNPDITPSSSVASAIFTQQLSQRAKTQELEHAERRSLAEQEAAEEQRKTDQLRSCYLRLNANESELPRCHAGLRLRPQDRIAR
jgi:regulator of protease activity HflC (stomatin/prohibitin superfamily)